MQYHHHGLHHCDQQRQLTVRRKHTLGIFCPGVFFYSLIYTHIVAGLIDFSSFLTAFSLRLNGIEMGHYLALANYEHNVI